MSLVNDALKKARMEAARGDATSRNIPHPVLGAGDQAPGRGWLLTLGIVGLMFAAGGFFMFRAGKQSALRVEAVGQRSALDTKSAALEESVVDQTSTLTPSDIEPTPPRQTPPVPSPTAQAGDNSTASRVSPSPVAELPASDGSPGPSEPAPTTSKAPVQPIPDPVVPTARSSAPARPPRRNPPTPDQQTTGAESEPTPLATTSEPLETQETPSVQKAETTAALPEDTVPQEFLQRADLPGIGAIELGGIAWSGDRPFALINGRVLGPGDSISGLVVDDIQPNTVRLRGDTGLLVFRLK